VEVKKKIRGKSIWMQCSICKEIIPYNYDMFGLFDEKEAKYVDIKQRCMICKALDEEKLKKKN
jgi:hypothetical protein